MTGSAGATERKRRMNAREAKSEDTTTLEELLDIDEARLEYCYEMEIPFDDADL